MTLRTPDIKHATPLSRILWERHIRKTDVAKELDVDQSTVVRWCDGSRTLPPARKRQIARLLGIEESELEQEVA